MRHLKNGSVANRKILTHMLFRVCVIAAGKPEEAIAMFEKALRLNPDPPVWMTGNLAIARVGAGQPEKSDHYDASGAQS